MRVPKSLPLFSRRKPSDALCPEKAGERFLPRVFALVEELPAVELSPPMRNKPRFKETLRELARKRTRRQLVRRETERAHHPCHLAEGLFAREVGIHRGDRGSPGRMEKALGEVFGSEQLADHLMEEAVMLDRRHSLTAGNLSSEDSPRFNHKKAVLRVKAEALMSGTNSIRLGLPDAPDLLGDLLPPGCRLVCPLPLGAFEEGQAASLALDLGREFSKLPLGLPSVVCRCRTLRR